MGVRMKAASDEYDAYIRARLIEMKQALDEGRKVWGWQFGARLPVASVETGAPNRRLLCMIPKRARNPTSPSVSR